MEGSELIAPTTLIFLPQSESTWNNEGINAFFIFSGISLNMIGLLPMLVNVYFEAGYRSSPQTN